MDQITFALNVMCKEILQLQPHLYVLAEIQHGKKWKMSIVMGNFGAHTRAGTDIGVPTRNAMTATI